MRPDKVVADRRLTSRSVSSNLRLVKTYERVLTALADPTRRKVFERLRAGPKPVAELARGLPVSRPAVSQHLAALKRARLVQERRHGTRRYYAVDRAGLDELSSYLDDFWGKALDAFKFAAERGKE